jgi:hypothetical protein
MVTVGVSAEVVAVATRPAYGTPVGVLSVAKLGPFPPF